MAGSTEYDISRPSTLVTSTIRVMATPSRVTSQIAWAPVLPSSPAAQDTSSVDSNAPTAVASCCPLTAGVTA